VFSDAKLDVQPMGETAGRRREAVWCLTSHEQEPAPLRFVASVYSDSDVSSNAAPSPASNIVLGAFTSHAFLYRDQMWHR
jgi:hypothetical protein